MANETSHMCPCCGRALFRIEHPHAAILYCPWGCPCAKMNDGGEGMNDQDAFQKLEATFGAWLAKQEAA